MGIINNISSQMILGELNKNTKKKSKAAAELALGEKIKNAGDDASGYAISEKMRVRIRALDQDDANVEKGASMLRVAEGAVQSQINLLRTIKERVINAHNDTNSETDRMIIQKEISQYYEEINDIAAETTFNKRLLLLGNTVQETVKSWVVMDHAEMVEGSDSLNMIPDVFDSLDDEVGPFDTFGSESDKVKYDGYNLNTISAKNITGYDTAANTTDYQSKMHGGTENSPNHIEIDLSGLNTSGLDNTAFQVRYPSNTITYVLTTDTSRHYRNGDNNNYEINISGMDKAQIASAIAAKIGSQLGSYYTASASGEKVTLATKDPGAGYSANVYNNTSYYNVHGVTLTGGDKTSGTNRSSATATGLGTFTLSGGKNEVYHYDYNPGTDLWDKKVVDAPATYATISKNVSSVPEGSGFILSAGSNYYVGFVDGNTAFNYDSAKGHYVVGKNWTGSYTLGYVNMQFSGGSLTMTSTRSGTVGNSYGVSSDGFSGSSASSTSNYYTAALPLSGMTNKKDAVNGDTAHWDWDLPDYNVSDADKAEELIDAMVGKAFSRSYNSTNYEFIDSGKAPAMESINKINSSSQIDLNTIRENVENGQTVSEAFANLIISKLGSAYTEAIKNGSDEVTGVKIKANTPGTSGNNQYVTFMEGDLRDYTVDFAGYFTSNGIGDGDIASALDGKGLRFYCATDSSQWVNIQFVNGISPEDDDRPESGTESLDIKTFVVDVSDVTDASSLVKTIYEGDGNKNPQGLENWLTNEYKHFFHVAADYDAGSITIYDNRRYTLLNNPQYRDRQEKGAKIADGVLDNVIQDKRYVYVNDLVIHHTDRSSANIHVRIPQTTMDHIFGYKVGSYSLDDYSVLTSEKREKLLGKEGPPKVEGTLDKGLQYLIDANTLIGAQITHMDNAKANIVTDRENTTSAESVIRDANMAKSAMALATAEILSQSGQAMFSQSNQNSSNVLNLLQ